jgi:hypothetical protein
MDKRINVTTPADLHFLQPKLVSNLARIGNKADGGYAISPRAVNQTDHLISLGLGENWSFEVELSRINPLATIDVYDHSVGLKYFLLKFFKGLTKFLIFRDSKTNLIARFLRLTGYLQFWYQKPNSRHHKIRITEKSFKDILVRYPWEIRLGIKIDIEGSEWEVLEIIELNQSRFEFIVIEFHQFDQHVNELREFIVSLSQNFVLAHLHANNFESLGENGFPRVFELTLLKNSNAETSDEYRTLLPVQHLDAPNAKNRPDYSIIFETVRKH